MSLFYLLHALLLVSIEYSKFHGKVASQIIEGKLITKFEDHNYMVGLGHVDSTTLTWTLCGGSILGNKTIVTAAHCIYNRDLITLYIGSKNIYDVLYTVNVTKSNFIIHPEYINSSPFYNDIAIIELDTMLEFGPLIGKIKMVESNYVAKKMNKVTMFGFTEGILPNRTKTVTNLNYVSATIADFNVCETLYQKKNQFLLKNRQFCVNLRGGKLHSTNQGDSGGPVVTKDNKLLGIISHDWNGLPEVCTLITGYLDFIANPRAYVLEQLKNFLN